MRKEETRSQSNVERPSDDNSRGSMHRTMRRPLPDGGMDRKRKEVALATRRNVANYSDILQIVITL